ncbi:hypothetical protein [Pseudomonas sp.]|uniref:hypothetical protein n=1 Tax=Pseudomonas sp. TaxID=306 RepID=UPI003F3902BB
MITRFYIFTASKLSATRSADQTAEGIYSLKAMTMPFIDDTASLRWMTLLPGSARSELPGFQINFGEVFAQCNGLGNPCTGKEPCHWANGKYFN